MYDYYGEIDSSGRACGVGRVKYYTINNKEVEMTFFENKMHGIGKNFIAFLTKISRMCSRFQIQLPTLPGGVLLWPNTWQSHGDQWSE